jgi:tetratricopeptide (TPR) repeat protein
MPVVLSRSAKFGILTGVLSAFLINSAAFADAYAEQGMKLFKQKSYAKAAAYFEESIKNVPWESQPYYYAALSYHYQRDFKKATEKYAMLVEKFPGTEASNNAIAALNQIAPNYLNSKNAAPGGGSIKSALAAASAAGGSAAIKEDKGTVEGQPQTRITFRKNQSDNVIDVRINGRTTRAIFDPNAESTSFSRQQLQALAIQVPKGASEFKGEIDLGGVVRKNAPITVDDSGQPAKIGQSFLEAFTYRVDEVSKYIDIKRKGGTAARGSEISFTRDGKDIIVSVEVNGRAASMVYDSQGGEGMEMNGKQAKSIGLRTDEAEERKVDPNEGPQRGDPNWVTPEDRPSGPKHMPVRVKFGPMEKVGVNCAIVDTHAGKYPKFSGSAVNDGSWVVDVDYKMNKIRFTKK